MASSTVAVLAPVLTVGADVPDGVANNERDELTGTAAPSLRLRQKAFHRSSNNEGTKSNNDFAIDRQPDQAGVAGNNVKQR
jgi:hypothetical protein